MAAGRHVALVGDSIFDNGAYTRGEPAVIEHLRDLLPPSWEATLCAVDGATTQSVGPQFDRVPAAASHVVMSIGGNDALGHVDLLDRRVASTAEGLRLLRHRLDGFEASYVRALDRLLQLERPTTVCTIYNGNLDRAIAAVAGLALMTFNDVIMRAASGRAVDVIELRHVCTRPEDYANPIEPSGAGGRRIAAAIVRAVMHGDHGRGVSRLFGQGG
jgi:hypothetical protein